MLVTICNLCWLLLLLLLLALLALVMQLLTAPVEHLAAAAFARR